MSDSTSAASPLQYAAIAVVVGAVATLALVAPTVLLGLAMLAAPFTLLGLATDADRFDVVAGYPNPYGPELRALPTI